ncbi:MAG: AbrB/MazE/SpoVT family DNA-binding domain-containing protein [Cyanobium sp.]
MEQSAAQLESLTVPEKMQLLERAGLNDVGVLPFAQDVLTIRPVAMKRASWAEAAAAVPPEGLLDAPSGTRFDHAEWHW